MRLNIAKKEVPNTIGSCWGRKMRIGFIFVILLVGSAVFVIQASAAPNENGLVTLTNQPVTGDGNGEFAGTDPLAGLSLAPANPEFLDYLSRINNTVARQTVATEYTNGSTAYVFLDGEIPSPVDLSHTQGQHIRPVSTHPIVGASYPGSYDLRTVSKISPVKNQGNAASCWAFGAVASLESYSLPGESLDLSENNIKNTLASTYTDGFDRASNGGGNDFMSTAYLTRWSGPVRESDDPYNAGSGISPGGLTPVKHVQNVYFLPQRANPADNDNIKYALTTWGAVTASVNFLDPYYNDATYAFYNVGNSSTNHKITLIGWDDSYSGTNFKSPPAGDGAFIAKNSWGSEWGDQGYFYISYYDMTVGNYCSVFTSEPVSNYDRVYSYDPLGWTGNIGYGTTTAQFANIFTAQSDETLKAAGFYTTDINTNYIVSVYLSPNNGPVNSGGYAARTSGTLSSPGYHTVTLPDVALTSGQKYSVVVSVTTPSYIFPVAYENNTPQYSSHATAHAGESYISSTGVTWFDLTLDNRYSNANVCVKAYTNNISAAPGDGIAIFRPSSGYWYYDYNRNGVVDNSYRFGMSGDQPVKGDWQGTGTEGIAIFRPSSGYWYFDNNLNGVIDTSFRFGKSGDQPVKGDWQGTGTEGIAIFRPSSGYWYFDNNLDGVVDTSFRFGKDGDQAIAGNWSGTDGIAIFRSSSGYWYFDYNLDGVTDNSFRFGKDGDQPVVGNWSGTGTDGIAIFRPSSGYWYFDYNLDGVSDNSFRFGKDGDQPVKGDLQGSGTDGITIFRPSSGYWYFDNNLDGVVDTSFRFGKDGDHGLAGKWA